MDSGPQHAGAVDWRLRLLNFLQSCNGADPEAEHSYAEALLREWIGESDPEMAEAWSKASENWWYA